MVNFYRRFLPNCAKVLRPDLLKGGAKTLEWTASSQKAFQNAKCHSNTPPQMLNFLSPLTPPILISEGSCSKNLETIGGSLVFISRKLTDKESHYSTFDRELLAAQAITKHFCHFCEGCVFQLWTNHKSLVTALSCISISISPRQQRHLAFNLGLKNVVADSPPPHTAHWNSRRHGSDRSSGLRIDGC
jgi:hypothetical protein